MTPLLPQLKQSLNGRYGLFAILVSLVYLILPGAINNIRFLYENIIDGITLTYFIRLFTSLLVGSLSFYQPLELLFFVLTAILLGINVSLLIKTIPQLKKQKSLSLSFGGTSLIALVGTGCASCGISLLTFVGISSSFVPFHGIYLFMISSTLLFLSLTITLRAQGKLCEIA